MKGNNNLETVHLYARDVTGLQEKQWLGNKWCVL